MRGGMFRIETKAYSKEANDVALNAGSAGMCITEAQPSAP